VYRLLLSLLIHMLLLLFTHMLLLLLVLNIYQHCCQAQLYRVQLTLDTALKQLQCLQVPVTYHLKDDLVLDLSPAYPRFQISSCMTHSQILQASNHQHLRLKSSSLELT
jgi:hypothetical protein